jgi:hypothetical protein
LDLHILGNRIVTKKVLSREDWQMSQPFPNTRRRFLVVRKVSLRCLSLGSLALACLISGCIANVQVPAVDQFHIVSERQEKGVNAEVHAEILLNNLFELLRANEGVEVPICTAAKDSRQCISDGFSVFVWGGVIPGVGGRTSYVFSEVSRNENKLAFTKDNRTTTFIGTPMYAQANKCQMSVKNGGLQVEMDKYYANWMGVGQMFMAEGWAIDYMDLQRGVLGLQLELDIQGVLTVGGGSRYLLLKFPNIPESLPQSASQLK